MYSDLTSPRERKPEGRTLASMDEAEVAHYMSLLGHSIRAVIPTDANFVLVLLPKEGGDEAHYIADQLADGVAKQEMRRLADSLLTAADSIPD